MASLAPPLMTDREWRLRIRIDKLQDEIEDKDARIAELEALCEKRRRRMGHLEQMREDWRQKYLALRFQTGSSNYRAGVAARERQRLAKSDTP